MKKMIWKLAVVGMMMGTPPAWGATGGGTFSGGTAVNTGGSTAINGIKVMTNGNSLFTQMGNASSDYNGQIGISGPGVGGPSLWFANAKGTGSNIWQNEAYLYAGVGQIGSYNNMKAGQPQTLGLYWNGNPTDMSYAARLSRQGTGLYLNNPNCFVDGCFLFVPTYTTNNTGGLIQVGTTSEGYPVYLKNAFGHQFGFVPAEFPVGRTNQTGHYIFSLSQGDYPVAGSWNTLLSGENAAVYNQHSWIYADPSTKEAGFPLLVPNVYTNGQAGWLWVLKADLATGQTYIYSNLWGGGSLRFTNNGPQPHIIGPSYLGADANCAINLTTNTYIGPGNDVPFTLCLGDVVSANVARNGVVKQASKYPKYAVTTGAPYEIAESSEGTTLFNNIASQTLKPKVHISTTEVTLTESSATIVFNVTIAAGKSCSGRVMATTRANDATDLQTRVDSFVFTAVNKAGTVTATISTIGTGDTAVTATAASTLATTWTVVANGASVDIKNSAVSSLTQTTLKTTWRLELDSSDAASAVTPN